MGQQLQQLCEPGGLAVSADGSLLFIADTNNHCIRLLNLDTYQLSTLEIHQEEAVVKKSARTFAASDKDDVIKEHRVPVGRQLRGRVDHHPEWKLNTEAPSSWVLSSVVSSSQPAVESTPPVTAVSGFLTIEDGGWIWKDDSGVVLRAGSRLELRLKLYLCSRREGICVQRRVRHQIELVEGEKEGEVVEEINLGGLF